MDTSSYRKDYNKSDLWDTLASSAKDLGYDVVFNALKLYYAVTMGKLSTKDAFVAIGALGYLISPLDCIPDILPGGWIDDAAVLSAAIATIAGCSDKKVIIAAKSKTNEWFA